MDTVVYAEYANTFTDVYEELHTYSAANPLQSSRKYAKNQRFRCNLVNDIYLRTSRGSSLFCRNSNAEKASLSLGRRENAIKEGTPGQSGKQNVEVSQAIFPRDNSG